ncbi:MAG: response regulator [Candidatus Omnitrophica bacterium]|nr:response regulator [Candidatus Omnitrophota bacterium]
MPKILVVDDDPSIRSLLTDLLSDKYMVETVEDGLEAMAAVLRDKPNVIIIDFNMNMPSLDGISVVNYIIETPRNKDIKFILISGLLDEEMVAKWKATIKDAVFFKKPFTLAEITEAIEQLLAANK